jgi:hypothetical protein
LTKFQVQTTAEKLVPGRHAAARFQRECIQPGSHLPRAKANKKASSNAPTSFDLRGELYRISRTSLTQIDGINVMNAQTIIAEVGVAMSRFPDAECPYTAVQFSHAKFVGTQS